MSKPSSFQPVPPLPFPFHYPARRLPPNPWLSLKDGERQYLHLIKGMLGSAFIQTGYTLSRGSRVTPKGIVGLTKDLNSYSVKVGPVSIGVNRGAESLDVWESIRLPSLLSQKPKDFPGEAHPVVTFELKLRGKLWFDSEYSIYYEDHWSVSKSNIGQLSGSAGVFVSLAIVRIAILIAAIYGLSTIGAPISTPILQPS